MTLQAPVKLHRIRNDQLYHYYRGDPLELPLLRLDGSSKEAIIGPDLAAGGHVQFFIPGGAFHTARVIGQRRWLLGADASWATPRCWRKSIHTSRKKFGAFRGRVSVLRRWERATPVAHLRVEAKEDCATKVARSQR